MVGEGEQALTQFAVQLTSTLHAVVTRNGGKQATSGRASVWEGRQEGEIDPSHAGGVSFRQGHTHMKSTTSILLTRTSV